MVTLFWTINPVITGLIIPGNVPIVLDNPIVRPAYWGATSMILALEKSSLSLHYALCY